MTQLPDVVSRTEIRDGMKITWHQAIPMDDGLVLRADMFAPIADGKYPVILTYGIYAKGLAYQDGYPHQWRKMVEDHPEILEGSTNKYQNWEVTDPERWIPHGYVVLRVDSRGAGWSPGFLDCNSPREIQDIYQCIEWAGTQPWSNGKVGMLGISYYASNQWRVAGLHPPHLAAIIPWEGQNDRYRDSGYHGGILSEFQKLWAKHQVANIQYGRGDKAMKNPNTGESVAGPVTLSDEELAKNRVDAFEELKQHPFDDAWHRARSADLSLVTVPLLTCANWGGQGIHPRGNFNGFTETACHAEVARGARRLALVAVLERLRARAAEALLRLLPEGDRQRLGRAAARAAQRSPSRRDVHASPRARMAAGPHALDQALSRPGRWRSARHRWRVRDGGVRGLGTGVTFSRTLSARPRSRDRCRPGCSCRRPPGTPISS